MTDRHYNVLIVEDTRELSEIIQIVLAKYTNIITHAEADGQHALETYHRIKPDLILLDLNLPDMRGWNVLDEIRRLAEDDPTNYPLPKVIVTTAYSDPANRVMGKLQDIIQYLVKPFTPTEVEKAVLGSLGIES